MKSITESNEGKLNALKDEHLQQMEAQESEHTEAIKKLKTELGAQIEELKKKDIDMQAANKILKK